jgi:hypothetical protein
VRLPAEVGESRRWRVRRGQPLDLLADEARVTRAVEPETGDSSSALQILKAGDVGAVALRDQNEPSESAELPQSPEGAGPLEPIPD